MKCPGCEADADSLKCTQCGARTHENGEADFSVDDEAVDETVAAAVALDHDNEPEPKPALEGEPEETRKDPKPNFGLFGD